MDIEQIYTQVDAEMQKIGSAGELEEFQLRYLGRKGILAQLTGSIPGLPPAERAAFGLKANALKNKILALVEEKKKMLGAPQGAGGKAAFDLDLPGACQELGRLHPLTQLMDEICAIFTRLGFAVVEGPEIESEYNNFTGLNIPLEHPSRDAFDTFYLCQGSCVRARPKTQDPRPKTLTAQSYFAGADQGNEGAEASSGSSGAGPGLSSGCGRCLAFFYVPPD